MSPLRGDCFNWMFVRDFFRRRNPVAVFSYFVIPVFVTIFFVAMS